MESRHAGGATKFFLPIGDVDTLEAEVFFLVEIQGQPYDSVMELPCSRRKRYVEKKQELEQRRQDKAQQEASRARSRMRRGRR